MMLLAFPTAQGSDDTNSREDMGKSDRLARRLRHLYVTPILQTGLRTHSYANDGSFRLPLDGPRRQPHAGVGSHPIRRIDASPARQTTAQALPQEGL